LREVNPGNPVPNIRYLFNHHSTTQSAPQGYSSGTESVVNEQLVVEVDTGDVYMQFYPSPGGQWEYAKEWGLDSESSWSPDFDRLSFKVRMPEGYAKGDTGGVNIKIGTYECDCSGQGTHWYHHLNVASQGPTRWLYVQMDQHPDHLVGQSGTTEWGNQTTYMDSLKRFYFDGQQLSNDSVQWVFDDFVFWQQEKEEDEDNVYTLHAIRNTVDSLFVGWRTHKDSVNAEFAVSVNGTVVDTVARLAGAGNLGLNGVDGIFYAPNINPCIFVRQLTQTLGKEICLEEELQ